MPREPPPPRPRPATSRQPIWNYRFPMRVGYRLQRGQDELPGIFVFWAGSTGSNGACFMRPSPSSPKVTLIR